MNSALIERNPAQDKGLRAGTLGLLSSVVIAVSSTAPAYSMAATLGLVVAIVGVHSPGTMIVSFLPMLAIAYAFRELNKVDPDCGTTFTWTTRAFGPWAVVLVAVFAVVAVACLVFAGPAFLAQHSDNVLGAMSGLVLGTVAGKLLILCVLTSATASTQTTIMPTARAVLAMAAHRALPARFARMHPRYLTPTAATVTMGAVSAVFFVALTVTSRNVLADSAASVGLLIAFYYGLTGFACVWFFRRDLLGSVRSLVLKGILPGFGGLALLAAFILSIVSYWPAASSYSSFDGIGGVFLIGAGSLLAGVVAMLAARRWLPAFFTTGTLPPLAPAGPQAPPRQPAAAVTAVAAVTPAWPAQVLDPA